MRCNSLNNKGIRCEIERFVQFCRHSVMFSLRLKQSSTDDFSKCRNSTQILVKRCQQKQVVALTKCCKQMFDGITNNILSISNQLVHHFIRMLPSVQGLSLPKQQSLELLQCSTDLTTATGN